jgi:hypothetical protein
LKNFDLLVSFTLCKRSLALFSVINVQTQRTVRKNILSSLGKIHSIQYFHRYRYICTNKQLDVYVRNWSWLTAEVKVNHYTHCDLKGTVSRACWLTSSNFRFTCILYRIIRLHKVNCKKVQYNFAPHIFALALRGYVTQSRLEKREHRSIGFLVALPL